VLDVEGEGAGMGGIGLRSCNCGRESTAPRILFGAYMQLLNPDGSHSVVVLEFPVPRLEDLFQSLGSSEIKGATGR
jgi:hypothetical protein